MDPLSHLLDLTSVEASRRSRLDAAGAFAFRFEGSDEVRFGRLRRGTLWVGEDHRDRHRLRPGDCFVLATGAACVLAAGPHLEPGPGGPVCARAEDGAVRIGAADEVSIQGGQIELDPISSRLLFAVMPPVAIVERSAEETESLRAALDRFFAEAGSDRPGASFAAAHLGRLICLSAMRGALGDEGRGWLAALADPLIGDAVGALHTDPGRRWQVAELAEISNLAPSSFAARFRSLVGEPPLAHMRALRMRLAGHQLRTTARTIAVIAADLGYSSEAAFSRAFKRASGVSPSRWRVLDASSPAVVSIK